MLRFPSPFWRAKIGEGSMFGCVATSGSERPMFDVFYDVSQVAMATVCNNIFLN